MKNLNYEFFDEYARLEKLCENLLGSRNGVTAYIEIMKNTPFQRSQHITGWKNDLFRLKQLRHIRNRLAHQPGAFKEKICTKQDIDWIKNFRRRISNGTDPLSAVRKARYSNRHKKSRNNPSSKRRHGCYIATCIYGSYDCPPVWTLRRYRDVFLSNKWYGRLFIRLYYAVSPILVKWFGKTRLFGFLWRNILDFIVRKLNSVGVESTPYHDVYQ